MVTVIYEILAADDFLDILADKACPTKAASNKSLSLVMRTGAMGLIKLRV